MSRTVAQSFELYEKIKTYFSVKENSSLVIEINDNLPMSEWKTSATYTSDDAVRDRGRVSRDDKEFAAFYWINSVKSFNYFDYNFSKGEDLLNGQIDFFESKDLTRHYANLAAVEVEGFLKLIRAK